MDFNYTPEQEAYRMEVRGWLEANQPPPLRPEEKERADENFLWERLKLWHKKLYDGGWAGLTWPKEYGGRGATFIEQVIFQQELGRLNLPMGCNVLGVIMTGPALMQWGTDEQKKRYLQNRSSRGDEIWCEGMSEPGAGSDLAVDPDPRRARGRRLRRQRAEGLDHDRASLGLLPALRAHRSRRAQAQGTERAAGRYEERPA